MGVLLRVMSDNFLAGYFYIYLLCFIASKHLSL